MTTKITEENMRLATLIADGYVANYDYTKESYYDARNAIALALQAKDAECEAAVKEAREKALQCLYPLVKQYRELTEGKYEIAEIDETGTCECPMCEGEGYVDARQFINFDGVALNVCFSGIGDEHVRWQKLFDDFLKLLKDQTHD